jgi:hypothetical protein
MSSFLVYNKVDLFFICPYAFAPHFALPNRILQGGASITQAPHALGAPLRERFSLATWNCRAAR